MVIRMAKLDDAPQIAAIYAPIVTDTTISFEEQAPDAGEMALRIEKVMQRYPWLVAVDEAGVAGYAYATEHRSRPGYRYSVEVSAYVAQRARRRGAGRQLYERLFADCAEREFHRAFAGVALPNDASVALHTAVGFEPIGVYHEIGFKFGRWIDVAWFQRGLP
ncbi:MAG: N-acetyltransferase [Candidatus Eremiobacteraeota bacterium]|nr:N-acetyltransferase [Candidatus Eremiobacteraeota bacterium]